MFVNLSLVRDSSRCMEVSFCYSIPDNSYDGRDHLLSPVASHIGLGIFLADPGDGL